MHFSTEAGQRALRALPPEHAQAAVEHAQALDEAALLMAERTASYGVPWRTQGALGNLLKANQKLERLMAVWWHGDFSHDGQPALHKDALDDAFDAINYLAFFIWCARHGNITGERTAVRMDCNVHVVDDVKPGWTCINCGQDISRFVDDNSSNYVVHDG